ncbi:hypothetical protein EV714DRAFT_276854 [Schizophyllum commune]
MLHLLTDDIIQLILCFLPNYPSLGSAILVCKAFHSVWRTYPIQIRHSILLNVVGPAYPHALSLVRHELASACRTEVILGNGDHAEDMAFTVQKRLMKVAGDVRSLRSIFSAHYKNGRPLNVVEMHRFDRAMYHLMLYSKKFGFDGIPDDDERWEEWDNSTIRTIRELRRQGCQFLQILDLEELRELTAVVRFIMDLADVTFKYNFSDLDILMGGRQAELDEISYWCIILEDGPDVRRDPLTALRKFDDSMLEPAPCRDGAVSGC